MEICNAPSSWLDERIGGRHLQELELRTRSAYAGACCSDRTWVITSEPAASLLSLDHADKPFSNGKISCVRVEDDDNWDDLPLEKALALLADPDNLPSISNFVVVIQKCRKQKCVEGAARLHAQALGHGLDSHKIIGNHLVPMLVACGRVSDAQSVFDRLNLCAEHAWTALMHGYIDSGDAERALALSSEMFSHGVEPSRHSFVAVLKACTRLKRLRRGRKLHGRIIEEHYESDLHVGNTLVDMYAKCGCLLEAQKVFDTMPVRDVVSWTALLGGYTDHGELGHEALACLDRMRAENVVFNNVTLICALKACGLVGHGEKGQALHTEAAMAGYEDDLNVGNALVDMYTKCGQLEEAGAVFDKMPKHDHVSFNSLIAGYAERGFGEEALQCLDEMRKAGIPPDAITFTCGVKACGAIAALDKGRELHAEIDRQGFGGDRLVGNALLDMYCRCGSVAEAEACLDQMPLRDVVSWTTLMAGYVEEGLAERAWSCFRDMQREGICPDTVAYLLSVKACSSLGSFHKGREIHAEIKREGYDADLAIGNALVDMYANCGALEAAHKVLHNLPVQNVVGWTALISRYVERGLSKEALELFEQMKSEALSPNAFTYACALKACTSIRALDKGRGIHSDVTVEECEQVLFVGNSLVDFYGKLGLLREAQDVFDELCVRDVISWTSLLTGYANHGSIDTASKCFVQMQLEGITPEAIAYNSLIMGCANAGQARKPLKLFHQMSEQGILPDSVTFLSAVKACANGSSLEKGRKLHARILHHLKATDDSLASALIGMYSKLGSMNDSRQVFDAMQTRGCVAWTSLMAGYARNKENRHVLRLFEKMRRENVRPDGITFLVLLNACRVCKFLDEGQKYFEMMSKEYGIMPTREHKDSMVGLLQNAGRVEAAMAMIF